MASMALTRQAHSAMVGSEVESAFFVLTNASHPASESRMLD